MKLERFEFGTTKGGERVEGIRIDNEKGLEFSLINYGATLISVKMADKKGNKEECMLGFDNMADYEDHGAYIGATIGRVGNRIGGAKFTLDGTEYKLGVNDQDCNNLHGGPEGFDTVLWNMEPMEEEENWSGIRCTYTSPDGEGNFPGNLKAEVQYILTDTNQLIMEYWGQTDKRTPVNMTNHSYWNLSGNHKETIHNHKLQIEAESYLPVDGVSIPTGELRNVEGTPFDFRELKEVGPALEEAGGFDHNFNLSMEKQGKPVNRMYVEHTSSGRAMEVTTTEPGVQFYTGNFLHLLKDKGLDKHYALCLETQMYPDAVNKPDFPSIILNPGEMYRQKTVHTFSLLD